MGSFSAPNSAILTTVTTEGSAVAGQTYSLICTVSVTVSGLLNMPTTSWSGSGPNIEITTPSASTSVLTFDPLKTSHAIEEGYTCTSSLMSPALDAPLVMSVEEQLVVKSKTSSTTKLLCHIMFLFSSCYP